jgi:AraC-like DNA-binding protein
MIRDWHKYTPVYSPVLSTAHLIAEGALFHLGPGALSPQSPQPPHIHDCYEIGYIQSGYGILMLGDQEYPFEAGQVYIINDLAPHMGYAMDGMVQLFAVHFQPAIIDGSWISQMRAETQLPFLPNFNRHGPLLPVDDPVNGTVRELLDAMRTEAEHAETAWEVIVSGLIVQAAGHLARRLLANADDVVGDQRRRDAFQRIQPILKLIEDDYTRPLSLDEMAGTAHLSRSHCCALFQLALGTTPIAYRNNRRLMEGQRLLRNTTLTVREIAYRVGFRSVQEFDRLFRREVGMPPRAFRQQFDEALRNIRS